ncbi:hypothetical protein [Streptomyces virginiae]|uniref:hypothetical protein n=1 Tax=Streptomyces virginiae TaxID=1961 RepID=UPI0036B540AD
MARQQPHAYAWPTITQTPHTMRRIYLDLNHWISLAKAATGHRDGNRHKGALQALSEAASSGSAVFPLSATHYMEMSGIRDPRQRADIADVMEELSAFTTLANRTIIMRHEIEAAVDQIIGVPSGTDDSLQILSFGVGHAFGVHGRLRVRSREDGGDVTDLVRGDFPAGAAAFDAIVSAAERFVERGVLRGPSDAEVPGLAAQGWDPTTARTGAQRRADREIGLSSQLDAEPRWRRGRLRDVVSGRYLTNELFDLLNELFSGRQVTDQIFGSRESARRFADSMPSGDVHITLTTAAHRNRDKQWTPNDIFDIDALSTAVPYCDAVVTERHACHVLRTERIPAKTGTEIMATLQELVTWLHRE